MAFTVPALLSTAIAESKSPGTALVSKSSVPPTVQTGIKNLLLAFTAGSARDAEDRVQMLRLYADTRRRRRMSSNAAMLPPNPSRSTTMHGAGGVETRRPTCASPPIAGATTSRDPSPTAHGPGGAGVRPLGIASALSLQSSSPNSASPKSTEGGSTMAKPRKKTKSIAVRTPARFLIDEDFRGTRRSSNHFIEILSEEMDRASSPEAVAWEIEMLRWVAEIAERGLSTRSAKTKRGILSGLNKICSDRIERGLSEEFARAIMIRNLLALRRHRPP
jgi:hypothetical protein